MKMMTRYKKSELRSALLLSSFVMVILLIWIASVRWHDLKGSCFIDTNSLLKVEGIITSSAIEYRSGSKSSGWHYKIAYQFTVNSRTYRSDKVTFGYTGMRDRSLAESYIQKYPTGKVVTVYYEKHNPSFSVLDPNFKEENLIFIPIGIVLMVAIFIWTLMGYSL